MCMVQIYEGKRNPHGRFAGAYCKCLTKDNYCFDMRT